MYLTADDDSVYMEKSRGVPTTTIDSLDSIARRELIRQNWHRLSRRIWVIFTLVVFGCTSAYYMTIFKKGTGTGTGFYAALTTAVLAVVVAVYTLSGTVGIGKYIHQIKRCDGKPATARANSVVVIDRDTKEELMEEYWSVLISGIVTLLLIVIFFVPFPYFLAVRKGITLVAPIFIATVVVAAVNFVLLIGKASLLFLFYIGCEDCVGAMSQNVLVMLLLNTINANAIFERLHQDDHDQEASANVTTPEHLIV